MSIVKDAGMICMKDKITRVDGTPMSDAEYDSVERSFVGHQLYKKYKRRPTDQEVEAVLAKMREIEREK